MYFYPLIEERLLLFIIIILYLINFRQIKHDIFKLSCKLIRINTADLPWASMVLYILGDPGAVNRVGRKGGTKVFKYGRKEPLGTDSHRAISKNSSECWLLIGHKKCFILLCPNGEQSLLSSFREFLRDDYCLDHGLSGSWTKEMQAVRKRSVWHKIPIVNSTNYSSHFFGNYPHSLTVLLP